MDNTNVTSADLGKEFRSMLMKVAQQLTRDELTKIAYQEGFTLELPPTGVQDMRVHLLHKLEAKGVFSPKNPDGFIAVLKRLPKEELIGEVEKYKQLLHKSKKSKKHSSERGRKKSKERESRAGSESKPSTSTSMDIQGILEDLFATAMTQVSKLMSTLEELKLVMQMKMPTSKMFEIMPQVKKVISILANDDQAIGGICESIKKLTIEVPTSDSKGAAERKRVDTLLNRRAYKDKLLPLPTDDTCPVDTEVYDDIVTATTLKGTPSSPREVVEIQELELLYKNVPGKTRIKTKKILPAPIEPTNSGWDPNAVYDAPRSAREFSPSDCADNLYDEIKHEDLYEEITNSFEEDQALYGNIASSSSGTGTGSGGGNPNDWLPNPTKQEPAAVVEGESLLNNPAYLTRDGGPTTNQFYTEIDVKSKLPDSFYAGLANRPAPPLPPRD